MEEKEIKDFAKLIAGAILKINTDYRGNLFEDIGIILKKESQNYTGNLFIEIANTYGIKKLTTPTRG